MNTNPYLLLGNIFKSDIYNFWRTIYIVIIRVMEPTVPDWRKLKVAAVNRGFQTSSDLTVANL